MPRDCDVIVVVISRISRDLGHAHSSRYIRLVLPEKDATIRQMGNNVCTSLSETDVW